MQNAYRLNRRQVQKADIVIYNVKGQKVKEFSNLPIENGSGSVVWNGLDDNGMLVPDRTYFYKLAGIGNSQIKKMVLIK
jgi:flagellar hook assembly protein FlgD